MRQQRTERRGPMPTLITKALLFLFAGGALMAGCGGRDQPADDAPDTQPRCRPVQERPLRGVAPRPAPVCVDDRRERR